MKFNKFNEIDSICKKYNLENYTINSDGSVDVDGDVDLRGIGFWNYFYGERKLRIPRGEKVESKWTLNKLPLKFRYVSGDFDCRFNNLSDLKGCPIKIEGSLYLYHNKLKSLEGCPDEVDRLLISDNELESLKGCPKRVRGDFNCSNNKLTSLEFSPNWVGGYFSIDDNPVTDPKGFPSKINLGINSSISWKNTPLSKLVSLLVDNKCGCQDLSCSSISGNHSQDWKLIFEVINMINQYDVVNGSDLNTTNLQRLYYDMIDEYDMYPKRLPKDIEVEGYNII